MDYPKLILQEEEKDNFIKIDPSRLIKLGSKPAIIHSDVDEMLTCTRTQGEFQHQAIILEERYDWVMGKDSKGFLLLIPLKKEDH